MAEATHTEVHRHPAPTGFIRTALGLVLLGSGIVTIQKGDPNVWPIAAAVAGIGLSLVIAAPHWLTRRRARNGGDGGSPEDGTGTPHDRAEELTPELVA